MDTSILISLAEAFVSPECAEKYFVYSDFFDADCFKALLSKGLGYAIIAGSLLVKVPQIVKILTNKSAEGINIFAVFLDLFAITFNLAYNYVSGFPFSAYGDCVFLALQTVIIGCLVLHYGGSTLRAVVVFVAYLGLGYVLMGGITPKDVLWTIQACNIPIMLLGKSAQALTNFRSSSTGQLSAATCFMLFFGSLARIFTSYQETGDFMMILMYVISTTANGVIVAQLLWYWNSNVKQSGKAAATTKKINKSKAKKVD